MVCAQCARDSAQRDALEVCMYNNYTDGVNFQLISNDVTLYQDSRVSRGYTDDKVRLIRDRDSSRAFVNNSEFAYFNLNSFFVRTSARGPMRS